MNELFIGITSELKGPQVPSVFNFPTRCDVFIDRYGVMYDSKNHQIRTEDITSNGMLYVYFMGIVRNTLSRTLTIQQYTALHQIFIKLNNPHIIFSDAFKQMKKVGEFSF